MDPISARLAFQNLVKSRPYSVWASEKLDDTNTYQLVEPGNGGMRMNKAEPGPTLNPKFTLPLKAGIFTAGSCFAREVEHALIRQGGNVLSWTPRVGLKGDMFHRYTTHALIADFKFALGDDGYDEANIVPFRQRWVDFTGHGTFDTREEAIATRRKVLDVYKRSQEADAIFLTFGLVEAWLDNETGQYLNIPPWGQFDSGRYTLKVTNYAENRKAIEEFVAFLRRSIRPDLKLLFTVSPVPLAHTFSGQDIMVANAYSKATLRAVAQDIASGDPLIDYFPSYEMVTLADPNEAWYPDFRHVRREFVGKIMEAFLKAYMIAPEAASAADA